RVGGKQTSHVPADKVAALFAHFERAGFAQMDAEYTYPVTDNPTATLTLTNDEHSKTVRDYPPCHQEPSAAGQPAPPPELRARQKEVEEVAGTRQWVACVDDAGADTYCRP